MKMRVPAILLTISAFCFLPGTFFSQEEDEPQSRVAIRNPQLLAVLPMGAQRGTQLAVDVQGEALDGAFEIRFVERDVTAKVLSASFTRIRLEVRVEHEAEPGPRHFRAITPRGASNLLLFRISEWPVLTESEPNEDPENLPRLEWPVLLSGKLQTPRDVDLFRFHCRAGERISLHLLAYRNWSLSDLSLALLDMSGRPVKQDEGTFIWDPFIDFTSPKDSDYIAAVMLTRMPAGGQSGRDLVYQLAIGAAPTLFSVFPMAIAPGSTTELRVRGDLIEHEKNWRLEHGTIRAIAENRTPPDGERSHARLAANLSADAPERRLLLGLGHPSGIVAPLSVISARAPVREETEPNDDLRSAEPISVPVTVNGRIQSRFDEDWFAFDVEAGESLTFDVDAEKLGSKLDARIVIMDSNGKAIQAADDAKGGGGPLNWDPRLEHTFKEGGKYYLRIYDLQRRGDEDRVYTLTIRRSAPDFALRLAGERLTVPRGEKGTWTVNLERKDGYQGAVEVEISGLPAGVKPLPLIIPGDQNSGKLEIAADAGTTIEAVEVQVNGRGIVEGENSLRVASVPASRVQGSGPGFSSFVSTTGWVSVIEPPLFSLESAASEVFLVRGGTAEFGVKVSWRTGHKGTPEFSLENAPAGVGIQKVEMVDNGNLARLTLQASSDSHVGRTPEVTIIGTLVREDRRRSESAPRISIQVD